ncbi:2og-Fe oxygenase family protein [Grosmannia clavigera kw1407]|uniref:2og-Fe oxygenase family protein n=1 Tax=Grosmannia clavigera (strain kw1407 / UAMH 11150) TaxID=655863 RepID=F0XP54_GROCL|nr:2og-Fe oxygenase family protein [Grosmannia clavigera kw1407]EFX00074.1 2og-Fe oxygenase family protein [Grosmannia clavigera kw1407]
MDQFAPPPHPPPLLSSPDIHQLCTDGFVGLQLRPHLTAQLDGLLAAADTFFALPDVTKDAFRPGGSRGPPCSPKSTERGYSRLPGEKEYLTLRRSLDHLPPGDLVSAATAVWRDVARLLHRILGDIAAYLDLPAGSAAWDAIVADSLEPGCHHGNSSPLFPSSPRDDPPTLLRLFRYEHGGGGAEQHRDLGLLTLCVCVGKGLQVRPASSEHPASVSTSPPKTPLWIDAPQVTVMTGDTLHVLSGRRIPSAVHRVAVDRLPASTSTPSNLPSRRSIVFALRATVVGDINLPPLGIGGSVNALSLYQAIQTHRVNINTAKETRAAVRAMRAKQGLSGSDSSPASSSAAASTDYGTDADHQHSSSASTVGLA